MLVIKKMIEYPKYAHTGCFIGAKLWKIICYVKPIGN